MGGWYRLFCLTSLPVTPGALRGCPAAASFFPMPATEPLARSMVQQRVRLRKGLGAGGHNGSFAVPLCMEDLDSAGSVRIGSCW